MYRPAIVLVLVCATLASAQVPSPVKQGYRYNAAIARFPDDNFVYPSYRTPLSATFTDGYYAGGLRSAMEVLGRVITGWRTLVTYEASVPGTTGIETNTPDPTYRPPVPKHHDPVRFYNLFKTDDYNVRGARFVRDRIGDLSMNAKSKRDMTRYDLALVLAGTNNAMEAQDALLDGYTDYDLFDYYTELGYPVFCNMSFWLNAAVFGCSGGEVPVSRVFYWFERVMTQEQLAAQLANGEYPANAQLQTELPSVEIAAWYNGTGVCPEGTTQTRSATPVFPVLPERFVRSVERHLAGNLSSSDRAAFEALVRAHREGSVKMLPDMPLA